MFVYRDGTQILIKPLDLPHKYDFMFITAIYV
eukprot:UN05673